MFGSILEIHITSSWSVHGQSQELEVALSQIEIDPDNVRTSYDPNIVAGLRSALSADHEYINPPSVYLIGDGRYRVKHGSTRVLAARGVMDSMRVRVVDPPDDPATKLLAQMSENLLQGSLKPLDVARALKRLQQSGDGRERTLSQIVGALKSAGIDRNRSWVSMQLALLELPEGVQDLVNDGSVSADTAYRLRSLPVDQQLNWAQRFAADGFSREELRTELNRLEGNDTVSLQLEMEQRLHDAAMEAERSPGPSRVADPNRRNGPVLTRREIIAVEIHQRDARKTRGLTAASWAKTATDVERQLAQEALFLGGHNATEAIGLVNRIMDESKQVPESVLAGLNALRNLIDRPADLPPESAAAEFMALRMRRILANIGRGT